MATFTDLVAPDTNAAFILPAQKTLDLLVGYGVPYPGNNIQPPQFEVVTLAEANVNITVEDNVVKFLTQIYSKLKTNNFGTVALSRTDVTTTDPATQSAIYNFYTINNNASGDIVVSSTAKPFNSAISDLERTYHQQALMFIMDLFSNHKLDYHDNPHHDNGVNLVNVWTDFFQALYNKYISLVSNPASLEAFIASKTAILDIASLSNYMQPGEALFIAPIEVVNALIATNNSSPNSFNNTVSLIDPQLPTPSFYLSPELFLFRYAIISSVNQLAPGITPLQKIQYYLQTFVKPGPGTIQYEELLEITGSGSYANYYAPALLNGTFPRMNSTLFVQALVNITDITTIPILTLSSSISSDTLTVFKPGSVINGYQVALLVKGILYEMSLNTTSNVILFSIVYTTTGLTITYVDQTGTQNILTQGIQDLTLDFDTIQIGIPVEEPTATIVNVLQTLAIYPTILSNDQLSLLFNTTFS